MMSSQDVAIELNKSEDVVDARQPKNAASFYHSKRSAAEGMMDISLLTANANQLKFILYYNQTSRTFYPALSMIVLSLFLQIMVGFLLIFRVSSSRLVKILYCLFVRIFMFLEKHAKIYLPKFVFETFDRFKLIFSNKIQFINKAII